MNCGMHISRLLVAAAVCSLFFGAASKGLGESDGKVLNKGTANGTFAGIEQGDYAHFLLKDKKGVHSFFVLKPHESVQAYLDNPEKLKGRKIRVHWEERMQKIPEAGGNERIKLVTKVEQRT